jgi:hypothetical protein
MLRERSQTLDEMMKDDVNLEENLVALGKLCKPKIDSHEKKKAKDEDPT